MNMLSDGLRFARIPALAVTGQLAFPDRMRLETRVGNLESTEEEEAFVHEGFCEAWRGLSVRDHSGGVPDSLARQGGMAQSSQEFRTDIPAE